MGKDSGIDQINPQSLIQQQAEQNRLTGFTPRGNLVFGSVNGQGGFEARNSGAAYQVQESPFSENYRQGYEDLATTAQQIAAPRIQNLPLSPIDTTQYPDRQYNIDYTNVDPVMSSSDFSADAQRVEGATFQRMKGLLDPVFDQQTRRTETQLVNQGLPMGSEAYDTEVGNLRRSQNEQYSKAALDAVTAGRAEQSRLYGQALSSRNAQLGDQLQDINLTNTGRAQGIQEQQALRATENQEIAQLLGLQPVQPVEAKSFFAPSPVDVTGPYQLSQNAQIANQRAQQQQMAAILGGITRLGSAGLSAGFAPAAPTASNAGLG